MASKGGLSAAVASPVALARRASALDHDDLDPEGDIKPLHRYRECSLLGEGDYMLARNSPARMARINK